MARRSIVRSGEVELVALSDGSPERPTLIFIHGYPDTKEVWGRVLERLVGDFHTVAYDVRGAGESGEPAGTAGYDFERLGDDLLAIVDELAPGKRVHLIGHDWGGLQGWEFATIARFEGRLASFTAVSGPSLDQVIEANRDLVHHGRVLEWLRRAGHSWYILPLLAPGLPRLAWRASSPKRWRRQLGLDGTELGYPSPTLRSDGVNGANLYRRNIPRRLWRPRVDALAHVPVQLIIPTQDPYIPEGYYELAEQRAPDLRRRRIEAGHWALLTHPDEVARWIREFVEEWEARRH